MNRSHSRLKILVALFVLSFLIVTRLSAQFVDDINLTTDSAVPAR
jgi:hypothetical protein